jgi:hypothetical protein
MAETASRMWRGERDKEILKALYQSKGLLPSYRLGRPHKTEDSLDEQTMDGFQFFASLFSSLVSRAWPVAIFGCVWLFRERLAELLPLLRLKHKDWELSLLLDQAEKEAAKIAPTDAAQRPPPGPIPS